MELTTSKKAKLEAINNYKIPKKSCCRKNYLKGFFFNEAIDAITEDIIIQSEILNGIKTAKKLLSEIDIDAYIVTKEKLEKKQINYLYITEKTSMASISALHNVECSCDRCIRSFFLGVFISIGVLTDPSKDYKLEFLVKHKERAQALLAELLQLNDGYKIAYRRNTYVVYAKKSESIEDFLALVGAQSVCLEIMSGKVVKDIRNKVNRLTNCETANIAKASVASNAHIRAIELLKEKDRFDFLSDELKEIAQLKLDNPELSLTELGEISIPPLTKSSINRRMQKLCSLAQL